ncbi:MAG TPA: Fe-S metabolism protein SufE [Bacteroidetes bacterium]|nr:Fe-S metabolism protein SufE [Bacteroidota bacterium]HRR08628.1 SufE family protein [Rhodothermales bacterium]
MNPTIPSIAAREAEVIAEFQLADGDWELETELLIDQGNLLEPMDPALKTEATRVHGCVSQVWLHARLEEGRMHLWADSDSHLTKGIIALLIRVLNFQKPADIVQTELRFIEEIGLKHLLTSQRQGGLAAMVKKINAEASRYTPNA